MATSSSEQTAMATSTQGPSKLKVYGRKILDNLRQPIEVDFDELIFETDGREITVSLYRARIDGRMEVRANDGILVITPRAANAIEIETRRM